MSRAHPSFVLSALPPSRKQERLALLVAAALFVALLVVLLDRHLQLPRIDPFIPIIDTVLFINDLITAVLLYAQFYAVRSIGLLVLAAGYLFTALIIIPHGLTFPGTFTPTGLLGAGLQTTVWLYLFWHLGLPPSVIGYTLLKNKQFEPSFVRRSATMPVIGSIVFIVLMVCVLTWLTTAHSTILPAIMLDTIHATDIWRGFAAPAIIGLSLTAIGLLWARRTSILDLWLLVVLWAWCIETVLLSTSDYRFSFVWYIGRFLGVLSATLVLLLLLTESTKLYARLAGSVSAQEREREGQRMRMEVMIGSLAHELQQPLSAIVMNGSAGVRMLVEKPPKLGDLLGALEDIARDGRRSSQIVESIRTTFRTEVTGHVSVDVNQLVQEALTILGLEIKTRRISLQLSLPPGIPRARGNKSQLVQVLLNLVRNAVESMASITDRPLVLKIRTNADIANHVSILVEDSGAGVDSAAAARIFEPFFSTKKQGMGLGLSICRSIIEAHGGRLSVSAGAMHGSIFRIDLPIPTER